MSKFDLRSLDTIKNERLNINNFLKLDLLSNLFVSLRKIGNVNLVSCQILSKPVKFPWQPKLLTLDFLSNIPNKLPSLFEILRVNIQIKV